MRHVDTDVLIAGGGPAGGAAAIGCAERGLGVILVEREAAGRERPGETLHPGIEPLLAQLGLADGLDAVVGARHPGIWLEWGGQRRFEAFGADADGPWRGFQVMRGAFDALILARAAALGVQIRQPGEIQAPLLEDGRLVGAITDAGPVRARIVIDATGRGRFISRKLGVASASRSPPLVARYGYVAGSCPTRDDAPCLAADAAGWTWTARVRPGTYQWTRLSFVKQLAVKDWLPDELRGLTPLGPARGADVTWRLIGEAAGDGWFVAGDAAAMLDPTSSHGVLKAVMSGMLAAQLAAGILQQAVPADAAAAAYQRWLNGWFATDADRLGQFYRALGVGGFA